VGWGIIWPPKPLTSYEQAHRDALEGLIKHRRQQLGALQPQQFHYKEGWEYDQFLWEEGRRVEPGNMSPEKVPYYLCIVGSPERVPWEFQQYLDGEYAVGRLWFDDPEDCEKYVRHLIAYEAAARITSVSREVVFVGTQHENDRATHNSATELVKPLHDWVKSEVDLDFTASLLLGNDARKIPLLERFKASDADNREQESPALLFTAGHGLEFERSSDEQFAKQGALIFQDWPGWLSPPQPGHYLAADDINEHLNLKGVVMFCFACFSAGTPLKQDWVPRSFFGGPKKIAPAPFIARLPQKMLAGGALAFIGHVSKAWESSFLGSEGSSQQLGPFVAVLSELLRGRQVGHATDYLNARWIHLNVQLDNWVNRRKKEKAEVISLWQARNDFRGYVVLGDPAARMRVDRMRNAVEGLI
jgi:hypothetical protein